MTSHLSSSPPRSRFENVFNLFFVSSWTFFTFCPNNDMWQIVKRKSLSFKYRTWNSHSQLLLVADQLRDSTFLFEVNSEGISVSKLVSQLKL